MLFAALAGAAPASANGPGGAYASEPATVDGLSCRAACAGLDRVQPGSTVRISGEAMETAASVVFLGKRGRGDNVVAPATAITPTSVDVAVPEGARSGALMVLTRDGAPSNHSKQRLKIVSSAHTGGAAPTLEARVDARRIYFDGRRKASLSYFVGGEGPAAVTVELARHGEEQPLLVWHPGEVAPGSVQSVEWDGLIGGKPVAEGRYAFRVSATGTGARAAQAAEPIVTTFLYLSHRFPVQGKHDYGGYAASFGGGRDHKGQDVFARCGTPLVAARGGTVKHKAFQSRAGNYVVIAGGDYDYAYMHLRDEALVDKGDKVSTGQLIGYVGDTGRASGCHLHFEMWTLPGWFTGGEPIDPLSHLKAWDRLS